MLTTRTKYFADLFHDIFGMVTLLKWQNENQQNNYFVRICLSINAGKFLLADTDNTCMSYLSFLFVS